MINPRDGDFQLATSGDRNLTIDTTSPMRPKKSASTIQVSVKTCYARAGSSCWR
jgi:hypothetical protein